MKRCRSFPLLFLLILVSWAGLARASEVVVWHGYRASERTALEKIVAAYNAAHPQSGVQVRLLAIPSDAFTDKISATLSRGVGPDVFVFPQDRLGGWVEGGGLLEPLDFFLEPSVRQRYVPGTLEAMTYRGSVYALPLNFKAITLIYNKKLMEKPPRTTGEMLAMCKALRARTAEKDRVCLAYPYTDFYYHAALMHAFGGRVFDPGPRVRLDAPENVKSLEQLLRWVGQEGLMPAEPSTALVTSLFNEGKAAMVFSGPWFIGEIAPGIDYGLAPLPTVDEAGGKPLKPWMTVEGVGISAHSKHKDAAYDFVRYLTGPEGARVMALQGRQNPALAQIYEEPAIASDPVLSAIREQAEVALPMPNLPEMTMVWSPATSAMNAVLHRLATPKAALSEAQKAVQKDVAGLRRGARPASAAPAKSP
ncbi:extracellular solute-binding protein [Archangium violaceum]|uniref:extracellular solute-binding protein n=1 Tax=Archangium violaceum TaxID=83451 RepID=UPI00193B34B5|nr:extracellular solute-binding protein [Archangium violaceum]QRK08303.1 extracellular solute-binding protein [Archangium violaceum]